MNPKPLRVFLAAAASFGFSCTLQSGDSSEPLPDAAAASESHCRLHELASFRRALQAAEQFDATVTSCFPEMGRESFRGAVAPVLAACEIPQASIPSAPFKLDFLFYCTSIGYRAASVCLSGCPPLSSAEYDRCLRVTSLVGSVPECYLWWHWDEIREMSEAVHEYLRVHEGWQ